MLWVRVLWGYICDASHTDEYVSLLSASVSVGESADESVEFAVAVQA